MVVVVKVEVEEDQAIRVKNVFIVIKWTTEWIRVILNMDIFHCTNKKTEQFTTSQYKACVI